jgi:WXG100 family type VII secretion target
VAAIEVTSEQLHSVSSQLKSGSEDVAQQLHSMESKVKALVDADWKGAASDSFLQMWETWHRGASEVKSALDGISQLMAKAAQTYEETESQLAKEMRK